MPRPRGAETPTTLEAVALGAAAARGAAPRGVARARFSRGANCPQGRPAAPSSSRPAVCLVPGCTSTTEWTQYNRRRVARAGGRAGLA